MPKREISITIDELDNGLVVGVQEIVKPSSSDPLALRRTIMAPSHVYCADERIVAQHIRSLFPDPKM